MDASRFGIVPARSPWRTIPSAGSRLGSLLLGLGILSTRLDASPYITHRIHEAANGQSVISARARDLDRVGPSRPFGSLENRATRLTAPGRHVEDALRLNFNPGLEKGLSALDQPKITSPVHPIDLRSVQDLDRGAGTPQTLQPRYTVPEPASLVLLVTGAIGLAARRYLLRHRS